MAYYVSSRIPAPKGVRLRPPPGDRRPVLRVFMPLSRCTKEGAEMETVATAAWVGEWRLRSRMSTGQGEYVVCA
jgi:hypothetical protein